MPSIGALVDAGVEITPDRPDVTLRVRYLREAGILPRAARKAETPQVEVVHATSMLLALLKAGAQVDTVRAVNDLWHLPAYGQQPGTERAFWAAHSLAQPAVAEAPTFGQCVARFLADAAGLVPGRDEPILGRGFSAILVARDSSFAQVSYGDGSADIFTSHAAATARQAIRGRAQTITTIGMDAIYLLAGLVTQSRQEAARLGVSIPTDGAYRALGLLPPTTPGGYPSINPSWPTTTGPETTKADELPHPSAFAGQSAISRTSPVNAGYGSESEGQAQPPGLHKSRTDSFAQHSQQDQHHDRPRPYQPVRAAA